jgi:hypothetical protein
VGILRLVRELTMKMRWTAFPDLMVDALVKVLQVAGAVVAASLLIVVLAPFYPYFVFCSIRDDGRLRRAFRRRGRLMDWATAQCRTAEGQGVLLVEILPKGIGYTWWVDRDRLEALPPCQLPSVSGNPARLSRETLLRLYSTDTDEWCRHYLPALADAAHLVSVKPKVWQTLQQFPAASVLLISNWASSQIVTALRVQTPADRR